MTKEETIKIIKQFRDRQGNSSDDIEAFDMAIKALETQPCEDCISRADILDAIETWDKFGINAEQKLIRWQDHYVPYVHLDDVRNAIANMPSVTPTRPKGKLIDILDEKTELTETHHTECSICGAYCWEEFKYCPNCGAEMEIENEKETC